MSLPRQILPDQFYLITRSCTQQQFLLRPDADTINNFIYCLLVAAERFGIVILLTMVEANHHHTVIHDPFGNVSRFAQMFHRLFARCQNALRGRCENLWAAEEPCITRLLDPETVLAKLVYTAANPVKDGLVERAVQWPGVNGYKLLKADKPLTARRPRFYFAADSDMPVEVSQRQVIPAALGPHDRVVAAITAGVEEVERVNRVARQRSGHRVMGRRAVLRQSWREAPSTPRPARQLRPRFAGREATRVPALQAYLDFLVAYRHARRDWLAGLDVVFPMGTYQLARQAPIRVASAASLR